MLTKEPEGGSVKTLEAGLNASFKDSGKYWILTHFGSRCSEAVMPDLAVCQTPLNAMFNTEAFRVVPETSLMVQNRPRDRDTDCPRQDYLRGISSEVEDVRCRSDAVCNEACGFPDGRDKIRRVHSEIRREFHQAIDRATKTGLSAPNDRASKIRIRGSFSLAPLPVLSSSNSKREVKPKAERTRESEHRDFDAN